MKPLGPAVLFSPILTLLSLLCAAEASQPSREAVDAQVPVEELRLANGITVLMLPQPESTTVAVGWMMRVGSADDAPDQTGMSHLLEHMMFKGSQTIGTRDLQRELEALNAVDRYWEQKRDLSAKLERASAKRRRKLSAQLDNAAAELAAAQAQASSLALLGQYSFLYSEQGGTGLNASTYRDLTLYHLTLPSDTLELWFWLESDRLLAPVFREFYKEVRIIQEERRQRIESTPTGRLDERLREAFWGDHPYAWDPMGRSADLETLSRQDALEFLRREYRPEKMTLALVGGFDVEQVQGWARSYFGRLSIPAETVVAESRQPATPQQEERRLSATCPCPPQVQILYPSARFGESDADALQLLSAVLNGRTGRLFRSLVLDQRIAFSAYTRQISWRQAGEFSFRAESKGSVDPEELIRAWDRQLDILRAQPPSAQELQRALNRSSADAYRSLKDPTALMKQLLIYQGLGDWRYINEWTKRIREITPEDLVRVAAEYLEPTKRTVAIYRRSPPRAQP